MGHALVGGTAVFLIDDPGRRGHFTGRTRERPAGRSRRLLHAQREILDRYMREANRRLIPPTEGRIRSIEGKFQVQMEKFKQKGDMTSHSADVAYGVIRLGNPEGIRMVWRKMLDSIKSRFGCRNAADWILRIEPSAMNANKVENSS